jgi:endonuclease/exonuclease/phosphatase (EEP) superfamily protein YafD
VTQRSAPPVAGRERRLRIVSANLWCGGADPNAFAELVAGLNADVAATQEMTPEQADALGRVLPHGVLEPARDYTGMGIALRQPARVRRLPLPCRDARIADLEWDDDHGGRLTLEVVNVHVQAPHSIPTWTVMTDRQGQLRGLLRHIVASPQHRRVVVGDFNATPAWPLYRRLVAHLSDAAVAAARRHDRSVQRTWGPWPRAPRLLRIDHAFVHGVAVQDFQVLPIPGSDHSAIVVDIAVPGTALSYAPALPASVSASDG